jgi:hypothetical protein
MQALKLKARIDSSHRIEIQLPSNAPEGDAEVIVLIQDTPSPAEEGLRSFFDHLDRQSPQQRHSKEEIDAYLAKERANWD